MPLNNKDTQTTSEVKRRAPESLALPLIAEGNIIFDSRDDDRRHRHITTVCGFATTDSEDRAHAAFLSHAGNHYDELVETLRKSLAAWESFAGVENEANYERTIGEIIAEERAILAKVEARQ